MGKLLKVKKRKVKKNLSVKAERERARTSKARKG
jgi:hypothetical protein